VPRDKRALEVSPSEIVVPLFTDEVTLDHTMGNWYHFIKILEAAFERVKGMIGRKPRNVTLWADTVDSHTYISALLNSSGV
jgi:hypothetical protein